MTATSDRLPEHIDIAIVGAGFSGLAMAHELREAGREDFVILDRGHDIGGTWRDNTYPGCACDVPSHLYSFSWAPNPEWSSTFSPQPEIWDYLRHTAQAHDLVRHVVMGCALEEAAWDEDAGRWTIQTSCGRLTARVLISGAGGLSEPATPVLPGLERFTGKIFHSARWDHDHPLAGERVAVVGTGASAIQFVPEIQGEVAQLHVFQRTPPWIMPRRARGLTRLERAVYRRLPAAQRLMRSGIYWARELYAIPFLRPRLGAVIRMLCTLHLHQQVADPALRAKLIPTYTPGCKRILLSNDYLPALEQPNVEVITDGVAEVRERSVVSRDGAEREVDTIIFGTGFHVTDMPLAGRLRGKDGRTLAETWEGGMHAHKGTTIAGFPNLFFILGPNTGLGHTSVVFMSETQASYIARALAHMRATGAEVLEVKPEAEKRWNDALQRHMQGTVWLSGGCASWYLDAHGRNTVLWPGFTFRFRRALARFDPQHHEQRRRMDRGVPRAGRPGDFALTP
jgi:cation diffusion facilitator CzcD-associated flavoprotein CzcO